MIHKPECISDPCHVEFFFIFLICNNYKDVGVPRKNKNLSLGLTAGFFTGIPYSLLLSINQKKKKNKSN